MYTIRRVFTYPFSRGGLKKKQEKDSFRKKKKGQRARDSFKSQYFGTLRTSHLDPFAEDLDSPTKHQRGVAATSRRARKCLLLGVCVEARRGEKKIRQNLSPFSLSLSLFDVVPRRAKISTTFFIRSLLSERADHYCNDPSAGSPTETLLRLLLPLNAQVWESSRTKLFWREPEEVQSKYLTKTFNR